MDDVVEVGAHTKVLCTNGTSFLVPRGYTESTIREMIQDYNDGKRILNLSIEDE